MNHRTFPDDYLLTLGKMRPVKYCFSTGIHWPLATRRYRGYKDERVSQSRNSHTECRSPGGGGGVDSAHSTVGRSMTKGASSGGDWTQQKGGDSDA